MPKNKDRPANPATTHQKHEKQKALRKAKAHLAAQRTDRLAHRNPHRLEAQIADLVALRESRGGALAPRDARQLEELERDVARVRRARKALGERAPVFGAGGKGRGGGGGGYAGLGKRGRGGGGNDIDEEEEEGGEESEETDEEVRRVPWPRDTPPPLPASHRDHRPPQQQRQGEGTNANTEPLGAERFPNRDATATTTATAVADVSLPAKPPLPAAREVKMVYESQPQVRDLRKEATSRFVPQAVKRKIDAKKGVGGRLLEEEEVRVLEGEGYGVDPAPRVREKRGGVEGDEARRLREEEEAFARELGAEGEGGRAVGMEEVSDEDL